MRSTTLLALAGTALLAQARDQLTFSNPLAAVDRLVSGSASAASSALMGAERWAAEGVRQFGQKYHDDGDMHYETFTHDDFPSYQIRLKEPRVGCDENVKSYSGYLDIDESNHLFFWFFESRSNPAKDPVTLWLNGGPGCSSTTGLLFELGPCLVANGGENVTYNPHSWTEKSNVIFLDQPVQVGYSYGGKSVSNSQDAAEDVYAFLQLFYTKFPKFLQNEFHIAGESYAGTYIPNIASTVHNHNKAPPTAAAVTIPLKSLLIGNGLTASSIQFPSIPDYSCAPSKYAIFDETTCDSMRAKVPRCLQLTNLCYSAPSRFTCVPANLACWGIASPIQNSGRNPYDIRRSCDRAEDKDGPLCYKQMQWIETLLNKPEWKKELGAAKETTFASCNMQINQAFMFNGDVSKNTAALIPPLLEDGIRVLIYAGEMDFMCNWMGNLAWALDLEWSGKADFNLAEAKDFVVPGDKKASGEVRSVGKGAGQFAFLKVFDAGHMVPTDQPEASLEFYNRWLSGHSLSA